LENRPDEIAIFTDGDETIIEDYDGIKQLYHCGREYKRLERKTFDPILLIVIDANDSAIGTTDGERVTVLWHKQSLVPRKHRAGGQSQRRFERDRERALKGWLRMVVDVLKDYHEGRNIIVGGCGMTKDLFIKELPRNIQEKVTDVRSVGYTDENGLWELMKVSRYQ
jgi:peptide subunit release factor 1 (eRF1)